MLVIIAQGDDLTESWGQTISRVSSDLFDNLLISGQPVNREDIVLVEPDSVFRLKKREMPRENMTEIAVHRQMEMLIVCLDSDD